MNAPIHSIPCTDAHPAATNAATRRSLAPLPPAGGVGGGPVIEQRQPDDATQASPHGERYSVFTPDRQRAFLQNLELFGNVRHATRAACVSAQTAYRLRRQSRGFRLLWDAALLAARGHAEATLADRAIHGVEEAVFYHGEEVARRRRYDSRLLLAHLARLDRLEANAEVFAMLERLDECIDALGEGVGIEETLAGGNAPGFSAQDSVPTVPSCRNGEDAQEPDEEAEDDDDDGFDPGETPELERRLSAMEAARPDDAVPLGDLADAEADIGMIEAAQLAAFEAGVPRWWELVPGHGEHAEPVAMPACNPASATHAQGVSEGLLWEEERD